MEKEKSIITLLGFKCLRCSHIWFPKKKDYAGLSKTCPKCKSPYWNTMRKNNKRNIIVPTKVNEDPQETQRI